MRHRGCRPFARRKAQGERPQRPPQELSAPSPQSSIGWAVPDLEPGQPRSRPPACLRSSAESSIHSSLGFDVLNVVSERELVHRAVVDLGGAALAAPAVEPANRMLHPIGVVALGIIFLHVRAAALLAV